MTTLTINKVCEMHTPNLKAISKVYGLNFDEQFTFCEVCESNIERWADNQNIFSKWSNWEVSK